VLLSPPAWQFGDGTPRFSAKGIRQAPTPRDGSGRDAECTVSAQRATLVEWVGLAHHSPYVARVAAPQDD